MAHVFLLGGLPESLLNFRGPLIAGLRAAGHDVTAAAGGAAPQVVRELGRLGVDYVSLPLERAGRNPLADVRFLGALVGALRRIGPTDLFAYTVKPVVYGAIAARLAGVPHVHALITGLGYAFEVPTTLRGRITTALVQLLYRFALAGCDTVLFQNDDDRALFFERGLLAPGAPWSVVNGSGVDLDHFAEQPLQSGPPTFLLIARLLRSKGIVEYVQAARMLKQRHPTARFQLLGPTDPNPSAIPIAEVEAWQREGVVDYLGSAQDVRPYLSAATVYVLPSYREGTPRTVLEAMATGRAIVTTTAPGCRETVRSGENGWLVPVARADELAQAMERFLEDPQLAVRMGRCSREIAESKYDANLVTQAILDATGLGCATAR